MKTSKAQAQQKHPTKRGSDLILSISGIRGTIPKGLDPQNITQFALAFARMTGRRIVIGRDNRPTGEALQEIFTGVLRACGKEVLDVGLAPTPTIKAAVNFFQADAGLIVSASHNPLEWNGFKFLRKGGFFFNHRDGQKFKEIIQKQDYRLPPFHKFGSLETKDAVTPHIEAVLSLLPNLTEIKKKKYKVLVDAVGGAGREALPLLLEQLGCEVLPLYCDAYPKFPRPPEPTPKALRDFSAALKKHKADVGFALDPDADRLVCGSPQQGAINEEYTLPLAFMGLDFRTKKSLSKKAAQPLSREKGVGPGRALVVNLSTSRLLDAVALPKGFRVYRSAVGEANVVALMKQKKAKFGGEGNGGIIHADVPSFGRDSLSGAALVLSAMAKADAPNLDALLTDLPELFMQKTKLPLPATQNTMQAKGIQDRPSNAQAINTIFERCKKEFSEAKANKSDGLYLDLGRTGWLHLRASNTEPILRLIAEGETKNDLQKILKRTKRIL